jgi:PAS domain S-box-containing protein
MLGYSREDFIGLNVQDIIGAEQANLHARALANLASNGVFRASWRARRKDGTWVPTEVVTTQMPDKTYISIIRDVTERDAVEAARTAAETALRESEARYRSLFDYAPDGIIVIGETGSYLDINPSACAMLGYRRQDFIGLRGPDIIGKDQIPRIEEAANAIAAEGVYRAAWRLRHKGGSWVATEVVTTQMPDKTYISIIRDVTERDSIESARQAAEEALRETQAKLARAGRAAALGEVVATISHEINQPLAAIVTNSDAAQRWLGREPPDLDAARESLTHIARDSRRASQVIRRTREFLAGRGLERTAFDLNIALEEVVALSRTEQRRAGVVTRLTLAPDLPPVNADRTQIQQVALNLVLNALDAMGPTQDTVRRLSVSTSRFDGDWALVEVEDCGPGLEPKAAEQIFEQFFTTKAQGTGVGLAISRSIIDAHGGRIWAAQAPTGGAVFRFTVPLGATGSA